MNIQGVHSEKLLGVEAARGFAACLVAIYHAARHVNKYTGVMPFGSLTLFGHAGVDFFFVLSGFIIVHVHCCDIGRPHRIAHYLRRRITRVFPLYWVVLAASVGILILSPKHEVPASDIVIRNILLLPTSAPIVAVAWTLQLEMLFYACFLVLIANRAAGMVVFGLWACLAVSSLGGVRDWGLRVVDALASPYCIQFFIGIAAALLLRRFRLPAPRWLLAAGALGFAGAGMLENLGIMDGYAAWPARVVYGMTAMLLLLGLVETERSGRLRVPHALVALGGASYAIYLFHLLMIGVASQVLLAADLKPRLPPELLHLILAIAGIGLSVVVSRHVEKPLLRLTRRVLGGGGGVLVASRVG